MIINQLTIFHYPLTIIHYPLSIIHFPLSIIHYPLFNLASISSKLLTAALKGISFLRTCKEEGMPAYNQVRDWLFKKENHKEYWHFRKEIYEAQELAQYIQLDHFNLLSKEAHNNLIEDKNGNKILDPQKYKALKDYFTAMKWFDKHLIILRKLYAAHSKGLDYIIPKFPTRKPVRASLVDAPETEPVGAILAVAPVAHTSDENVVLSVPKVPKNESKEPSENLFSTPKLNYKSDITRTQAEELIGFPLLYGREDSNGDAAVVRATLVVTPVADDNIVSSVPNIPSVLENLTTYTLPLIPPSAPRPGFRQSKKKKQKKSKAKLPYTWLPKNYIRKVIERNENNQNTTTPKPPQNDFG